MMLNDFIILIDRKISFKNPKCSQTKSKAVLRRFIFHRVRLLPYAIKLNTEPPRWLKIDFR